uniref:Protein kinase domain-containing protein n=2 Tax=Palpitomonas bilix TaxID=652834 RepID=A0A7S3D4B8_9EUKA|mmetsp:Transcript_21393/g.55618  ORF Transcript_21393/g.55618 Transcript_21393/m.55618 type:complete len:380 (+) Transcript_21393:177-1316(+)
MSIDDRLGVAYQIIDAIAYVHEMKVIHRDLKPQNILFKGRDVKLIDFGLAVVAEKSIGSQGMTVENADAGTWRYKAPEQVFANQRLSGKTDVFAFGLILYELFSYKRPWEGKGSMEIMGLVQEARSKPAVSSADEIQKQPPFFEFDEKDLVDGGVNNAALRDEIKRIVSACTMFNPDFRPRSAMLTREVEKLKSVAASGMIAKPPPLQPLEKVVEDPTPKNFDFNKPYVFISYRSSHYDKVKRAVDILRNEMKMQVWLDRERIVSGDSWAKSIGIGVESASCILAFWSDLWMDSNNCRAEWNMFVQRVNMKEGVTRKDCFAMVVDEWDFKMDPEMKLFTFGNTVQYRPIHEVSPTSAEFHSTVQVVGEQIKERLGQPRS